MKRCPECRRDYYDETLHYCLDDGSALLEGPASGSEGSASAGGRSSSEPPASAGGRSSSEPPASAGGRSSLEPPASAGSRFGDEPATAIFHDTGGQREAATQAQIHITEKTPARPHTASTKNSLIAGAIGVLLVTALGVGSYLYYGRSNPVISSVAVMPFVNESGNPDVEYLSDGMTETLIASLSQIPNLSVKARSTVFFYKGKEVTPLKIGDELGVEAVLIGRVAERGDDVRLNLELVNTRTQNVVWSEQYSRKRADLVALQSEIARDVLSKLQTKLSGADEQKVAKTYTTNSEAYQYYLKGRYYWNKRTAENLKKAMEQFQQAADTDPNYALAYAGLADSYVVLGDYTGVPNSESLPKSRAFAERALKLDASLVEPQTSLAYSYALLWQWDRAEVEFKKAIELNPNYPTTHHWYSLTLVETGRFEEASKEIKRAQELDPLSLIISYNLALIYINAGDLNGSLEQSRRLIDLDPNFPRAHQALGYGYLKQERFPEAISEFQKAASLSPNDRQSLRDLGYGYGVAGQREEAIGVLKALQENYEKRAAFAADVAAVYAGLGDKDQAFAWLEKDVAKREGRLGRIRYHVPYESLRSDPRYADLLQRMGLPQ